MDACELWCWRRLSRVPWTARRSSQSILKEISPGCSLEGLMLKLKLQYFGHLMQKASSLEKTLMMGKIEGEGRRERQRMRWLEHHWLSGHELEQLWEILKHSVAWCSAVHGVTKSWTQLSNWTTTTKCLKLVDTTSVGEHYSIMSQKDVAYLSWIYLTKTKVMNH